MLLNAELLDQNTPLRVLFSEHEVGGGGDDDPLETDFSQFCYLSNKTFLRVNLCLTSPGDPS